MSAIDHWDIFRIVLGLGLALCNVGVWRGVSLEYASDTWTKETGKRLLVRSLAIEALLAFTLLAVDTTAGVKQKIAVANAETIASEGRLRAANAESELLKMKTPRMLTEEQTTFLIQSAQPFKGTPFDFSIEPEQETIDLMVHIGGALREAGWLWNDWHDATAPEVFRQPGKPQAGVVAFSGFAIQYDVSKTADWDSAAVALWKALKPLDASAKRIDDDSVTPTAIHIYIGKKPM
jgi:hypothetical protein